MENKTIGQKLLEFQCSIETIKKDGKNSFFKKPDGKASTYATLPHILSEVKPILNALKLVVLQPLQNGEVQTMLVDTESGDTITSGVPLPQGLNAQQTGSAITYFRRYTLCSLLALEIDEDDDGNVASQKDPIGESVKLLKGSKDLPDLQTNWKAIGIEMQKNSLCVKAKDEMKTKLTPIAA